MAHKSTFFDTRNKINSKFLIKLKENFKNSFFPKILNKYRSKRCLDNF